MRVGKLFTNRAMLMFFNGVLSFKDIAKLLVTSTNKLNIYIVLLYTNVNFTNKAVVDKREL